MLEAVSWPRDLKRRDLALDRRADRSLRLLKVMLGLQPHPECRGCSEEFGEAQRGFCRDASAALGDLRESGSRNARGARDGGKTQAHRFDEFLKKDFTRVDHGK